MNALQVVYVVQGAFSMPFGLLVALYFGRWVENPTKARLKTFLKWLGAWCLFDGSSSIVFLALLDRVV